MYQALFLNLGDLVAVIVLVGIIVSIFVYFTFVKRVAKTSDDAVLQMSADDLSSLADPTFVEPVISPRLRQLQERVKKREAEVAAKKAERDGLHQRKAKGEKIPESEEQKKAREKREAFKKRPEYDLIEKFSFRFGANASEEEIEKLRKTLAAKKWMFTSSSLRRLVRTRADSLKRKKITELITRDGASTFDAYVKNFVSSCDWKSAGEIAILEGLLQSRGLIGKWNRASLIRRFAEVDEMLEIEAFEAQLNRRERQVSINELDQFSGFEFEAFLKELFTKMGFDVIQTRLSGDQGADLVATKFNEKTVIQAKRFGAKVGNKAVQEVLASVSFYGASKGMVITNNYFTKAAVELANVNHIELVDKTGLETMINTYW